MKRGYFPGKEVMKMDGYRVEGKWQPTDQGRVYVARAISPKGRVLGVARFDVPVMTGFEMSEAYGPELTEQLIVQAAEEQAHRFGKAAK